MPNPTWSLTPAATRRLVQELAALPRVPAKEWRGNLGYRGFILRIGQVPDAQLAQLQAGTVRISAHGTSVYAQDKDRNLERWLLETGRPHLKAEIAQMVARELP